MAACLEHIGLSRERSFERAGLPVLPVDDAASLVPERPIWTLIEETARSQAVDGLGFLIAQRGCVEDIGVLGTRVAATFTLNDALRTFLNGIPHHNSEAPYWLSRRPGEVLFCRQGTKGLSVGSWRVEQYVITLMVQIVRLAAGPDWRPDVVYLQARETPGLGEGEVLSRSRILLGQRCTAFGIPLSLLSRGLTGEAEQPTASRARLVVGQHPSGEFVGSMRQALRAYLEGGRPDIHLAAALAGDSVRTLQRRLREAGTTFSTVVAQARFESAKELLPLDVELVEIALRLGYSEASCFSRAFSHWAGVSPREYRAQIARR